MNAAVPIAPDRHALLAARENLGLSRAELARMIPSRMGFGRRITDRTLHAFERSKRNPAPVTLAAWRAALAQVGAARRAGARS